MIIFCLAKPDRDDIKYTYLQGDTIYPHNEPFKPQFKATLSESQVFREWMSLYSNVPAGLALKSDENLPSSLYRWYNNNVLFKIDFSRYSHHALVGGTFAQQRIPIAQLDFFVDFEVATPENIVMLLYTSYPEVLSIKKTNSQERDVELFYSL